jgi:hypothetical protein
MFDTLPTTQLQALFDLCSVPTFALDRRRVRAHFRITCVNSAL